MSNPMIEIIDKLLSPQELSHVQSVFLGSKFPWCWNRVLADESHYQNAMVMYWNDRPSNQYYDELEPIIKSPKLFITTPYRIKANLNPVTSESVQHGFHTDNDTDCTTGIFYVNTNNGYTLFKDGTKVECIANRFVSFPVNTEHCGVTATDVAKVVINFNYFHTFPCNRKPYVSRYKKYAES